MLTTTQTSSPVKRRISLFGRKNAPPRKPKSALREWIDSVLFAVIVASLVHWLVMQPFTIPTSSMEKTLLVGDYLFVSKFHYGSRIPRTLLQIPLTHQTIWGTSIPSYLNWLQLPYYRLPGISRIRNNDVVVFNYPPELQHPSDLKTNYIKRCVGIAGDSLHILNKRVYVNGEPAGLPEKMQTSYLVRSSVGLNERVFKKYDITEWISFADGRYLVQTTKQTADQLAQLDIITKVEPVSSPEPVTEGRANTWGGPVNWTQDNFGPLYIPKAGDKIRLNKQNLMHYQYAILNFEGHKDAKVENDKLYVDGQEVGEYTFRQNYYFMVGDNRHNSEDSRYWGMVPEDHIVGKALFVWWSIAEGDNNGFFENLFTLPGRIRWSRLFSEIN